MKIVVELTMTMPGSFKAPRLLIGSRILNVMQMVLEECRHLIIILGEHNWSLSCKEKQNNI